MSESLLTTINDMSHIDREVLESDYENRSHGGYKIDDLVVPSPLLGTQDFSGNIMTVQAYRTIDSTLVQKVRANIFKTVWEYPLLSDQYLRAICKLIGQKRVAGDNAYNVTFQSPFAWAKPNLIKVRMYLGSDLMYTGKVVNHGWITHWECRFSWIQIGGGLNFEGINMDTGLPLDDPEAKVKSSLDSGGGESLQLKSDLKVLAGGKKPGVEVLKVLPSEERLIPNEYLVRINGIPELQDEEVILSFFNDQHNQPAILIKESKGA